MKSVLIALGCVAIGLYVTAGLIGLLAGLALAGRIERWGAE